MLEWLSMRYLLKTTNDETVEGCYEEIIELFDNKNYIIPILMRNATADQMTQIIKIFGSDKCVISAILHKYLSLTQIKTITEILNNAKNDETHIIDQNDNNSENKSYFDYISKESIFNICEFLDKTSIAAFKLTSICNALIVLEMMQCYQIGVFNMNDMMIQGYNIQNTLKGITLKINRIKPFTKLRSLIITYCKRYNISRKDLLIVQSNVLQYFSHRSIDNSWKGTILDLNKHIDLQVKNNSTFFIFDKTKIIFFNNNSKPVEFKQMIHFILLQYFDQEKRQITNVQLLVCNEKQITAEKMLEHIMNPKYNSWNHRIVQQIKERKQSDSKIRIYDQHKKRINSFPEYRIINNKFTIVDTFTTILFELDWCVKINDNNKDNQNPYYNDVTAYIKDSRAGYRCPIKYDGPDFSQEIIYFDAQCNLELKNDLLMFVTPQTTYSMIKHKICAKFNDKLPVNRIELYKPNHIVNDDTPIGCYYSVLQWKIVTYDTCCRPNDNVLKIKIFDTTKNIKQLVGFPNAQFKILMNIAMTELIGTRGSNFKAPIFRDRRRGRTGYYQQISCLTMYSHKSIEELRFEDQYSTNSKPILHVESFVQNVLNTLCHPMYGNKYNSIIDKYKNKDKYSFIMMNNNDINNKQYECYEMDNEFNPIWMPDFCNVNIFVVENKYITIDDSKQTELIPIIIRCSLSPEQITDWIDWDAQDIINLYSKMNKQEADGIMRKYLLQTQKLDESTFELDILQKEELNRGFGLIKCCERKIISAMLKQLKRVSTETFQVASCHIYRNMPIGNQDPLLLVQIYNSMLDALHKDEMEKQETIIDSNIGYPMKIFITKETLLQHILDHILKDNDQYVFESCLAKNGNIQQ